MRTFVFILTFSFMATTLQAQDLEKDRLPYYKIPEAPASYLPGNVLSRMVDGLGYRFYWASESLEEKDLSYKPSDDGKSTFETIEHIYDLSVTIFNVASNLPNVRLYEKKTLNYIQLRSETLKYLKKASDLLRGKTKEEIEELKVVFQRGDQTSEFPLWNFINGQLTDAIYHTGQIVAFRRASGNPIHSGINVFTGQTKE